MPARIDHRPHFGPGLISVAVVGLVVGFVGRSIIPVAPFTQPAHAEEVHMAVEHPVVFWELASHDADKSAAFFRDVFGWNVPFDESIGFFRAETRHAAGGIDGGIFTLRKAKLPFLTIYIHVDDVDAMAETIVEHGGHLVVPPEDVGGSRICLFNEPSGVTFAILERRTEDGDD
jgi:predicted enzyme related to lactoylglutathione lyase